MTIEEHARGTVVVLALDGNLILGDGAGLLKDKIASVVFQGHRQIVLNLGGVAHLDSTGLGELIAAFTRVTKQGGAIKIASLTKRLSDLLAIAKVLTVFDVYESEDEAVRAFSSS